MRSDYPMHAGRVETLGSLDHLKGDRLSFSKCTKAIHLDLTEMNEEIFTLRLFNESIALFGTKPLHSPLSQPCNLRMFRGDAAPEPTPL